MKDTAFYLVAGIMLALSAGVVAARNILHAALYLIFTLSGTALVYLFMNAEFAAIAQVLVYIGGIVIVVVFTILLTSHLGEDHLEASAPRRILSALLALAFLGTFGHLLWSHREAFIQRVPTTDRFASLDRVGVALLATDGSGWLIPFELISLLLLAAVIGAIVLARRDHEIHGEEKK